MLIKTKQKHRLF